MCTLVKSMVQPTPLCDQWTAVDKKNLEEAAYQKILSLILEHRFQPGDFLLETELAERFNMRSRTPVRHALTQLVAKGFLEKKRKKGYYIPFPTRKDAEQVFFAREQIEAVNAAEAARLKTDEDIAWLRRLLDREEETGRTGKKEIYSGINEGFHTAIARMAGNPYLEKYSHHLFWRSSFYVFYFGSYYTEQEFVRYMLAPRQHQEILTAIASGDVGMARDLMRRHVSFTAEKVIAKIVF